MMVFSLRLAAGMFDNTDFMQRIISVHEDKFAQ
jgi:hypothetical protein